MKRRSRSDEDHGNGSAAADGDEYEPDTQIAEKHTLTWMGDLCDTFQTTNRQMLRSTVFPFHFTTESVYVKGAWNVEIRHPFYTHNHTLSREVYDNYSHNCQVPMTEPIVEDLHLIVKASGKSLRIYEYIRYHSAYK
ncbi:hypothetical protein JG688_00017034, partial [Phytophthora aleatoria]